MDTIIAIIGVALAFGGLVPVFTNRDVKIKIIGTVGAVTLILIVIYQAFFVIKHQHNLQSARDRILEYLAKYNSMTLEQISDQSGLDRTIAIDALDELIKEERILSGAINCMAKPDRKYRVRIYNNIAFPITD